MRRDRTLPLGEISSGTLRDEDVVPALFDLADCVRMTREDRAKIRELKREWDALSATDDEDGTSSEVWSELYDVLDAYAPPCCYVGSLEGDGACIGVWVSEEAVRMGLDDGAIWTDTGTGEAMPKDANYRLVVSDHGNMSLYDSRGREVWGVV